MVPDPFIQVESQLVPEVPQPEFHGRDDDTDGEKARRREFAVRYIMEENRINDMNTSNERRLRKLGDAFWKAERKHPHQGRFARGLLSRSHGGARGAGGV